MTNILTPDRLRFMTRSGEKTKIAIKQGNTENLTWKSLNPEIASVSENGVVTAHQKGETTIFVENTLGASCKITVTVDFRPQNPVFPPTWGLFIADCEPHVFNGKFYIFGSKDAPDGHMPDGSYKYCTDEYNVIYSEDLLNWTDCGVSLNLNDIPDEIKGDGDRLWAPDVFRCPRTGKFYLTCCTNKSRFIILESDVPEGPYVNPRLMKIGDEPINAIDPSVLVDDDGKVYIASPNFWIGQLDPDDYSRIIPETVTDVKQFMPYYDEPFEGPSIKKRGNLYYYIYIQNNGRKDNGFTPTRMVYMTAENPLGPYTYRGLIITTHKYLSTTNVHGSIAEFNNEWYVAYHAPVANMRRTRTVNLEKISFDENGLISEVKQTSCGVGGAFKRNEIIPASSAVVFSGGRGDTRMEPQYTTDPNNEFIRYFTDFPVIWFDFDSQSTGYRYIDFSNGINEITVEYASECDNCFLEIRSDSDCGELISWLKLDNTNGKKHRVTVPADCIGEKEVYLKLKNTPDKGKIYVYSFIFC